MLLVIAFFAIGDKTDVEWYGRDCYLQQEITLMGAKGYHLYYKIDEEKKLILPQVYGYEKEGSFVYFASAHGYGMVNLTDGSSDIVLYEKDVPVVEAEAITYHASLWELERGDRLKLLRLPHKVNAYFFNKDKSETVGDGRFQCMFLADDEDVYHYSLEAYDLRIGGWHDTLLPSLNGCRINEKSQMMYVTSPHGCAVIDGLSGTCRVLLTNRDAAPPDYQKDIQVLDSFDQFTPEEQAILLEVEKEGFK